MTGAELTYKASSGFKQDPAGSIKALFFLLLGLVLLVVVFKFLKGFGKATELIGEKANVLGTTEEEKRDIVTDPKYQDALRWLESSTFIVPVGRKFAGKSKPADLYLASRKLSLESLAAVAKKLYLTLMQPVLDEGDVYNAIAGLPSKASVSFMAMVYDQLYNKGLTPYSLADMMSKRLTTKEMETVTMIINKKPEL
jgi:hypothetical protein